MFLDLIHNVSFFLSNLQPTTEDPLTTTAVPEPTGTSDPGSPCSNEAPEDNGSQVQPEDNNLTSLNGVEINLTNGPGSSQGQCNTFKPQPDATAGESGST